MVTTFANREQALFFVNEQRSLGNEAEIINDHSAGLWVPDSVGGYRVLHGEPREETDAEGNQGGSLEALIGVFFWGGRFAIGFILSAALIIFLYGLISDLIHFPATVFLGIISLVGLILILIYLAAAFSLIAISKRQSVLLRYLILIAVICYGLIS